MNSQHLKVAHILLVEDNEGDILLTLEAFEESRIKTKVSVARNGQEALDILKGHGDHAHAVKPDLILLDINIPIYNGIEVLAEIKRNENLKKIPVIMLTTSSSQNDVEVAYKNHCNSYIRKPLEMEEFMQAIKKIEEFWLQLCVLSK